MDCCTRPAIWRANCWAVLRLRHRLLTLVSRVMGKYRLVPASSSLAVFSHFLRMLAIFVSSAGAHQVVAGGVLFLGG